MEERRLWWMEETLLGDAVLEAVQMLCFGAAPLHFPARYQPLSSPPHLVAAEARDAAGAGAGEGVEESRSGPTQSLSFPSDASQVSDSLLTAVDEPLLVEKLVWSGSLVEAAVEGLTTQAYRLTPFELEGLMERLSGAVDRAGLSDEERWRRRAALREHPLLVEAKLGALVAQHPSGLVRAAAARLLHRLRPRDPAPAFLPALGPRPLNAHEPFRSIDLTL